MAEQPGMLPNALSQTGGEVVEKFSTNERVLNSTHLGSGIVIGFKIDGKYRRQFSLSEFPLFRKIIQ